MAITYSIQTGGFTRTDKDRVAALAEAFFHTADDPEQMPGTEITYELLTERFPLSLNVIKDGRKVIGHTFVLPCDRPGMNAFVAGRFTEKDLFYHIRDKVRPAAYAALYLASAQVLPRYQLRGIATAAFVMQVQAYRKAIRGKLALFAWPLSEEGRTLARRIATLTGLTLRGRRKQPANA